MSRTTVKTKIVKSNAILYLIQISTLKVTQTTAKQDEEYANASDNTQRAEAAVTVCYMRIKKFQS